jgi:TolA-binding protein
MTSRPRIIALGLALAAGGSMPLAAQSDGIGLRVNKLEKEMKAVQRKVFPGGVPVESELGNDPAPAVAAGSPASAPIADLNARVDALEAQLKTLTGQVEQDGFRLKKLEDAVKALQAAPVPELPAADPNVGPNDVASGDETTATAPKPALKPTVAKPVAAAATKPAAAPVKSDPARRAAIAAVEVPDTGDAAEDAYTYGFRLWTAKLYPEAQMKLKEFVAKNPNHKRASYAQNLLGRAYLDEGKPALASVAFYDNYQKMPRGDRAGESLYWLGVSLTRLKKPADACKVYKEFEEVYGPKSSADLKGKVAKGKTDAKCTA